MGNYRFRLSDMMPNAWFYKLKDMRHIANRSKKQAPPPPPAAKLLPGRASLYYSSRAEAERFSFSPTKSKALADRFEEQPRKSKRGSRKKPPAARPRLVAAAAAPELAPPETPREDLDFAGGESDRCCCRVISSATDIIIDLGAGDSVELNLRPVATKPVLRGGTYSVGSDESQEQRRPSLSSSRRLRVRANSPRLAHRSRAARRQKKTLPESALAVVKTSSDPQRDFRDSMMEMIVEHNIRASKDLEELLACYLSLNSDEYHDLIVKVFKQIWFDLN